MQNDEGGESSDNDSNPKNAAATEDKKYYSVQAGTIDLGKPYEEYIVSLLIVMLCKHDDVIDFRLSSNEKNYGNFDDVVVRLTLNNNTKMGCAIQLKHVLKKDKLSITGPKFGFWKYYEAYVKNKANLEKLDLIFLTNNTLEISAEGIYSLETKGLKEKLKDELSQFNEIKLQLKEMEQHALFEITNLNEAYKGDIYRPVICEEDLSENQKQQIGQLKEFCAHFFICVNQPGVPELRKSFNLKSDGMITKIQQKFVTTWMKYPTREYLRKEIVLLKMGELLLEPFILTSNLSMIRPLDVIFSKILDHFNIATSQCNGDILRAMFSPTYKEQLWNINEMNSVIKRYQITNKLSSDSDIQKLSSDELLRICWHMNKLPLIIKAVDDPAGHIRQGILLCQNQRKFILVGKTDYLLSSLPNERIFYNLSNLSIDPEDIPDDFTLLSQGREITLRKLFSNVDIRDVIRLDELIEMIQKPLNIGEQKELLPDRYMEQRLQKTVIPTSIFKQRANNFILIIDCNNDEFKQHFTDQLNSGIKCTALGDYVDDQSETGHQSLCELEIIYSKRCSKSDFDKIAAKNPTKYCIHMSMQSTSNLEYIRSSKGGPKQLRSKLRNLINKEEFDASNFVEECSSHSRIYLVTAIAGMGKSVLFSYIKNHYPTDYWVLRLNCTYLSHVFKETKLKAEHLIDTFLINVMKYQEFDRRVAKAFEQRKKIVFLWDELDELNNRSPNMPFETAISVIKLLKDAGFTQWIAARTHLTEQLEECFDVFAWNICNVDSVSQNKYIENRLRNALNDFQLQQAVQKITDILSLSKENRSLGVPLHLFILTELFSRNFNKYMNSDIAKNLSVVFGCFIEETAKQCFANQGGFHLKSHLSTTVFEEHLEYRMEHYELAAATFCFQSYKIADDYDQNRSVVFLEKLRKSRDDYGLIKINVHDDKITMITFIHETFGEYFIARWLAKRYRSILNLSEILFQEENDNIRRFFDYIFAEDCELHLAVLNGDLDHVQAYNTPENHKKLDRGGRNALHLASAWGVKHPTLQVENRTDTILMTTTKIAEFHPDKKQGKILALLLQNIDPFSKDELFNYTSFEYADAALRLQSLEILLSTNLKNVVFDDTKTFTKNVGPTAFYAVTMNYEHIFKLLKKPLPHIQDRDFKFNLLHLAIAQKFHDNKLYVEMLLQNKHYCQSNLLNKTAIFLLRKTNPINFKNMIGETALHMSTRRKDILFAKLLIDSGADPCATDIEGLTPLHYAIRYGTLEIFEFLAKHTDFAHFRKDAITPLHLAAWENKLEVTRLLCHKSKELVNVRNNDKWCPLHYAAFYGSYDVAVFLVMEVYSNYGIKVAVNATDNKGFTPLHLASQEGHSNIVKLLLHNGAKPTLANNAGNTPLHLVAIKNRTHPAKMLLDDGSKVNETNKQKKTPLHYAAFYGQFPLAHLLIEGGADVNAKDENDDTPLHSASEEGFATIAKLLVDKGADVKAGNHLGNTPIHLAAVEGHTDIVKILFSTKDSDSASLNSKGKTPLHLACEKNNVETIRCLMELTMKTTQSGWSALHQAVVEGNLEVTGCFVSNDNENINAKDENGNTPLHLATKNGDTKMTRLLIDHGADINVNNNSGITPLLIATDKGSLEIASLLIEKKANLSKTDDRGLSSVHVASLRGHTNIIKLLMKNGLNHSLWLKGDKREYTPLHRAAFSGHLEIVKLILPIVLDVNCADVQGFTPLHFACQEGNEEITKLLLESGADSSCTNIDGATPFHMAALKNQYKTARLLGQFTINAKTKCGWTPLHVAAFESGYSVVKLLLQSNGIDVNSSCEDGNTALHLAAWKGSLDIVELLIESHANYLSVNKDRATALHLTAITNQTDTARYLIDVYSAHQIPLDNNDKEDDNELHYAAYYNSIDVAKLLISKGAKVSLPNGAGYTALDISFRKGHLQLARELKNNGGELSILPETSNLESTWERKMNSDLKHLIPEVKKEDMFDIIF